MSKVGLRMFILKLTHRFHFWAAVGMSQPPDCDTTFISGRWCLAECLCPSGSFFASSSRDDSDDRCVSIGVLRGRAWPLVGLASMRSRLSSTGRCYTNSRLELPHLALGRIAENLRAEKVGFGRVGQRAVVENGQGFADRLIPWLALGDIQWRAFWNDGEDFLGSDERHAHTTVGRR